MYVHYNGAGHLGSLGVGGRKGREGREGRVGREGKGGKGGVRVTIIQEDKRSLFFLLFLSPFSLCLSFLLLPCVSSSLLLFFLRGGWDGEQGRAGQGRAKES